MKTFLKIFLLAGVFTACGKGGESATDSKTSHVNSTTPPATADTANPIGVMMSDTSTAIADSLNKQK